MMPKIEIDLQKIEENARVLTEVFPPPFMVAGVTKAVCGDPRVADAMLKGGVSHIADSRISNIKKMKESGVAGRFLLLRAPMQSSVEEVVKWADISLVSDARTIELLGAAAVEQNKEHEIIVMADMGDRREGVLPECLEDLLRHISVIEGIRIGGIGTNLACYGGVIPSAKKMDALAGIAEKLEETMEMNFLIVSGGNSANIPLMLKNGHPSRINHIRLGESILLGLETVCRKPIPGTHQDAFRIVGELVEVMEKPSVPDGEIGQDAFGNVPDMADRGVIREGLLALGKQDIDPSSLQPEMEDVKVLGANSDYMILEVPEEFSTGDVISFIPGYGSLLQAMTSQYVEKIYI